MKKLIALLVAGLFVTVASAQDAAASKPASKPGVVAGKKAVAETKKKKAGTELDAKNAAEKKEAKKATKAKAKKKVASGKKAVGEVKEQPGAK